MKTSRLMAALLLSCLVSNSLSSEPPGELHRASEVMWNPTYAHMNINRLSTVFSNDGWCDRNRATGEAAFVFPKGTKRTMIYQSGLLWGAKIGDSIHVGGSTYGSALQPGKILSPGIAEDPNLAKNRIYRVRPDYATADLSLEARERGLPTPVIRDQYARDWNEWPAADGAPFDDRNLNGIYEPTIDIPGKYGADQTIWFVANDLDTGRTRALYGRRPLGLEIQVTIWAYNRDGSLGNTLFKNYRLINKSTNRFDSLFVCQWVDTDLGYFGDDYLGCDVPLNLQYCYNGYPFDPMYGSVTPPAVGFVFLAQPMYAAVSKWSGSWFFDPPFTYDGGRQWYNWMRGLLPTTGEPFVHPWFPNEPTRYWLDGDPVTRTGRIELEYPGDRRMHASVGPFTLSPGETLEVPIAVIAGFGTNNVTAVTTLRKLARAALTNFPSILMSTPPVARVTVTYPNTTEAHAMVVADVRGAQARGVTAVLRRQNGITAASGSLFDDGLHGDGAARDGIWGNTLPAPREQSALYLDLTVVDSAMRAARWERVADNIPVSGPLRLMHPRVVSDNINSDGIVNPGENIRYGFTIASEAAFPHGGITLHPPFDAEFKMIRLGTIAPGGSDSLRYNPNDTLSYFSFTAPLQGTKFLPITISDTSDNHWYDTLRFTVTPYGPTIQRSLVHHIAGRSEWSFSVIVTNPAVVNNHTYEITIVDSLDTLRTKGLTLRDSSTGAVLLSNHPLPDELGHIMPVIDGFKLVRGEIFGRVGVRDDSTRWISSYPQWLGGSHRFWDEHAAFGGGVTTGTMLSRALASVSPNFDAAYSFPVEVRFSTVTTQKAYRLSRSGSGPYLIQSSNPFTAVPFTVWDVQDRARPRQLTVAWRDQNDNRMWDPSTGSDAFEIVFIYNKTYDPTGTTQFSMPPNVIPNECTIGANADIVYGLALMVAGSHQRNESPGTLYIRPWLALTGNDRFTFNPTVVLDTLYAGMPTAYKLYQNYPNPFNPATTIKYELPVPSSVTLTIYNILGQKVKSLVNGVEDAGVQLVQWDGKNDAGANVATGVYFYRLEARAMSGNASFTQVKKMLMIR